MRPSIVLLAVLLAGLSNLACSSPVSPATGVDASSNGQQGAACSPNAICMPGLVCLSGTCVFPATSDAGQGQGSCVIGGTTWASGAANPANACQSCQPVLSTTAWSTVESGTGCGLGLICVAGICQNACWIQSALYASGAVNPASSCQSCLPSTATSQWTNTADGTSCGAGKICASGSCQAGCWIGGAFFASSAADPANSCQSCQPSTSTSQWSDDDGTTCAPGKVCVSGDCKARTNKIMLVLDKSGSMATNPDDDNWGCCGAGANGKPMSGGTPCTAYDATESCKWNTLKSLLLDTGGFLDQTKASTRFGLAIFPDLTAGVTGEVCADGKILVDVGAGDNVDAIKTQLNSAAVYPRGGTPTADMLQAVVNDANFVALEGNLPRYVILITDGVPNCNSLLNGATCQCTIADCSDPRNCLDDTRTIDQIEALYATQPDTSGAGVKTFVIGFGADTTGTSGAAAVLNAAAIAGHTDQAGTTKYYQATSAADLQAVFSQLLTVLQP